MCTFTNQTRKRPVRTEITKTKALLEEEQRTETHQATVKFLQLFSRPSPLELQQLMGARWNDVQEALQAKKRYALPGPVPGTSGSAASAVSNAAAIAGQKRKQIS